MDNLLQPEITFIVAASVDGCLVGRDSDELDANKKWKHSKNIRGVIQQFFDFSPNTSDIYNLVTASTVIRIGIESDTFMPKKESLRLVVFDEENQLSCKGVRNLALSVKKLIVVTTKESELSGKSFRANCSIQDYKDKIDIKHLIKSLRKKHQVKKLTIQSSGFLNSKWIETGLINFVTVILHPLLVSNNGTPFLISKNMFTTRPLKLISTRIFDTDFLLLRYRILN